MEKLLKENGIRIINNKIAKADVEKAIKILVSAAPRTEQANYKLEGTETRPVKDSLTTAASVPEHTFEFISSVAGDADEDEEDEGGDFFFEAEQLVQEEIKKACKKLKIKAKECKKITFDLVKELGFEDGNYHYNFKISYPRGKEYLGFEKEMKMTSVTDSEDTRITGTIVSIDKDGGSIKSSDTGEYFRFENTDAKRHPPLKKGDNVLFEPIDGDAKKVQKWY